MLKIRKNKQIPVQKGLFAMWTGKFAPKHLISGMARFLSGKRREFQVLWQCFKDPVPLTVPVARTMGVFLKAQDLCLNE